VPSSSLMIIQENILLHSLIRYIHVAYLKKCKVACYLISLPQGADLE
jgi:hypothetical protein